MDGIIVPLDLQRMLLGDAPLAFNIEVLVRTVIIYAYTLALLRWLGSRTIGQLSTIEFLLVIALGSAVGDAMFYPEVPLVHAMLVVTLVVVANKGLDMLVASSKPAEQFIDGKPMQLIDNGIICKDFLASRSIGQSELFQQLRRHGVEHLGQVRAAFMEPDGEITVFHHHGEPAPGLPIIPPWGVRQPPIVGVGDILEVDSRLACMTCGGLLAVSAGQAPGRCPICKHDRWTPALSNDERRIGPSRDRLAPAGGRRP